MRNYTVEVTGSIWYEENGFRISFMPDPANSDYQAYLKSLEAEQSTPIVEGVN
jgi:hypothetical protein